MEDTEKKEDIGLLLTNLQVAIGLYTHEDNLNWTKFGMLVTFVFALCAGFSHFYEQTDGTSFFISLLIIILGFVITFLFKQKISSGLTYMESHKEKVKTIEKKLYSLDSGYEKIIAVDNKKISTKSTTTNIMNNVPNISFLIWLALFVLWLKKLVF